MPPVVNTEWKTVGVQGTRDFWAQRHSNDATRLWTVGWTWQVERDQWSRPNAPSKLTCSSATAWHVFALGSWQD
jgi:hypothetical protein